MKILIILTSLLLIFISSLTCQEDYPDPLKDKLKDLLSDEEIEQVRELSSRIKDEYNCDLSLNYLEYKAEEINKYKNDTREGIKEVGITLFYLLPREIQEKLAGGIVNLNDTNKEYCEGDCYPQEPEEPTTTTTEEPKYPYPDGEDDDYEPKDRKKRAACTFKNVVSAREKWPDCAPIINHVHHQGRCPSCWAFATSQVFADRRCIARAKKGLKTPNVPANIFSALDVLACSGAGDCIDGGFPADAWKWIYNHGLCTGSGFNEGCKPYTRGAFDNSVQPYCYSYCSTNWNTPYLRDKLKVTNYRWVSGNSIVIKDIMKEIETNGPVTAIFRIYSDFNAHTGGVYFKSRYAVREKWNHVIEIIGYGTQVCNGIETPYWLCKNSWGTGFAENGFFKISRGTNEVEIESNQMSWATPVA